MVDLMQMRYLIGRLPQARFNLDKAIARATKITSTITGMPHGSSAGDKLADNAIYVSEAREALESILSELESMRRELSPRIEAIDDPLSKNAMRLRYMDGLSVREIAYTLAYSEQHIFRVISEAEKKIQAKQKSQNQ